jgi:prepilin-type N-terminal cleavage/methylation domain-containing protein
MRHKQQVAFTLVEIMVVVAIIAVLAAIAVPSFIKSRHTARQNACIDNLHQIDSGKEQAAIANKWLAGDQPATAIVNAYIKGDSTPECPAGGAYTYNVVGTKPVCNILSPTSHRLLLD